MSYLPSLGLYFVWTLALYRAFLTLPAFAFEKPAISILIPIIGGSISGWTTRPDKTKQTYKELKQPLGHPPAWVFGPVWTCLYAGMGYAAYRAWGAGLTTLDLEKAHLAKQGATLYTIQLGLNLIWMPLFFGLRRPIEATADIVVLTGINSYLGYIWGQVDPVAGWIFVPYVAWLSFATYLSAGCGYLNNWNFKKSKTE